MLAETGERDRADVVGVAAKRARLKSTGSQVPDGSPVAVCGDDDPVISCIGDGHAGDVGLGTHDDLGSQHGVVRAWAAGRKHSRLSGQQDVSGHLTEHGQKQLLRPVEHSSFLLCRRRNPLTAGQYQPPAVKGRYDADRGDPAVKLGNQVRAADWPPGCQIPDPHAPLAIAARDDFPGAELAGGQRLNWLVVADPVPARLAGIEVECLQAAGDIGEHNGVAALGAGHRDPSGKAFGGTEREAARRPVGQREHPHLLPCRAAVVVEPDGRQLIGQGRRVVELRGRASHERCGQR